jgi:hypothetical protein
MQGDSGKEKERESGKREGEIASCKINFQL